MSNETVLFDVKDGVAHVTLNRPDAHNAFDEDVIARLSVLWDDIAGRGDVRAVILRGRGKSFSAGADMNWMKRAAGYTAAQNYDDALKLAAMLGKLYDLPQTTIACVQGAAMGGGFGLVCCCDVVIAEADTVFSLSEVKLGLVPATIGPYVMQAIGARQMRRFAQTGERFDGRKALAIGLVHELAERPEDVDYLLGQVLKSLLAAGPQATRMAKKLCRDLSGTVPGPDVAADTAKRIADIRAGQEAKEGLTAFLEKRKAAWIQ